MGGVFVDSQDKLIGGLLADLPLVSHAGAALSLIPADAARDAIKARELDEIMRDNFAELMNMCSGLFNLARTHRVRLSATSFAPAALASELAALAAKPTKRLDLEVDVEGYGKGRMILLLAP